MSLLRVAIVCCVVGAMAQQGQQKRRSFRKKGAALVLAALAGGSDGFMPTFSLTPLMRGRAPSYRAPVKNDFEGRPLMRLQMLEEMVDTDSSVAISDVANLKYVEELALREIRDSSQINDETLSYLFQHHDSVNSVFVTDSGAWKNVDPSKTSVFQLEGGEWKSFIRTSSKNTVGEFFGQEGWKQVLKEGCALTQDTPIQIQTDIPSSVVFENGEQTYTVNVLLGEAEIPAEIVRRSHCNSADDGFTCEDIEIKFVPTQQQKVQEWGKMFPGNGVDWVASEFVMKFPEDHVLNLNRVLYASQKLLIYEGREYDIHVNVREGGFVNEESWSNWISSDEAESNVVDYAI